MPIRRALVALAFASVASEAAAAPFSADEIAARAVERRAVEAMIWGMPAANYDLMRQEMLDATTAEPNQVIYWGRPLDWMNQTLTPNPDTMYFMVFFDTHDGPVVFDIPAAEGGSLNANFVTAWQKPLEDAGLLGSDKGAGERIAILPPGFTGTLPEGIKPVESDTYGGFALLRVALKSHAPEDVATALAYGRKIAVHPLSEAADPPETIFTDMQDVLFDSTIRYDATFFEHLNRVVQEEPWLDRDRAMIDSLATLGIVQGQPFKPDAATRTAFAAAAVEAHAYLDDMLERGWGVFFDGTNWRSAAPPPVVKAAADGFMTPDSYPIDQRGMAYSYAFVGIKNLGAGQFYLITLADKDGNRFDGAEAYRLHVPPKVPVEQYWSATAYDRQTHALIRNMERASRASNASELQKNADGSVDIFFGPEAPAGQESNWVPTDPLRDFEVMFRLYAPTKALFDKTWTLPDIEKVD